MVCEECGQEIEQAVVSYGGKHFHDVCWQGVKEKEVLREIPGLPRDLGRSLSSIYSIAELFELREGYHLIVRQERLHRIKSRDSEEELKKEIIDTLRCDWLNIATVIIDGEFVRFKTSRTIDVELERSAQ